MILLDLKEFLTKYNENKHSFRFIFKCDVCNKQFIRTKNVISLRLNTINQSPEMYYNRKHYCSHQCQHLLRNTKIIFKCPNCGKDILRRAKKDKKAKSNDKFCNRSCSASYHNTHKTHGTNISKLELWLQKQLITLYPNLKFKFNKKDDINGELDIYIPSLKLAFELNGIFHYEPIFGQLTLEKSQNNDKRKFQACIEKSISLCVIDTTSQKYFKEQTSQKFLDIITNIINKKMMDGIEPS